MPHYADRRFAFTSLTVLAFVLLLSCPLPVAGKKKGRRKSNPQARAEQYVLTQLKRGEAADLIAAFPGSDEAKRAISTAFLKRLLTNSVGGLRLSPPGVRIRGAVLNEPLELTSEKIPYSVSLVSCKFNQKVAFFHVSVAGDLNISNDFQTFDTDDRRRRGDPGSEFNGQALFINVSIDGDLEAHKARFKWQPPSPAQCQEAVSRCDAADFEEVKVTNDAYFTDAIFMGPADFEGAHFQQVFFAQRADFRSIANFVDVRVTDDANFNEATFGSSVDFTRARIENKFDIGNVNFTAQNGAVSFQDLSAGQLALNGATEFAGGAQLGGMTYRRITAADPERNDERAWGYWQAILNKSAYQVDAYATLEEFFQKQGRVNRANDVYIQRRKIEANDALVRARLSYPFIWIWHLLVRDIVGYGRRTWYAFLWSVVVIVAGCGLFLKRWMDWQADDNFKLTGTREPPYSKFWYSLAVFLPVVELPLSNLWLPRRDKKWLWWYMHIHALLGWLFISIGLASLTGIIK